MLHHLFPRLTPERPRGSALFESLVGEARREHWFVEGAVPDTLDGRFAALATIVALATVRMERGDAAAHSKRRPGRAFRRDDGCRAPPARARVSRALARQYGGWSARSARRVEQWRGAVDSGSTKCAGKQPSPPVVPVGPPSEPALRHASSHCGSCGRGWSARPTRHWQKGPSDD